MDLTLQHNAALPQTMHTVCCLCKRDLLKDFEIKWYRFHAECCCEKTQQQV
jgi:hypothetical protein